MDEFDVHPLQNEWTFWIIQIKRVGSGVQYDIEPVITFGTVEAFWNTFLQFPELDGIKLGGIALFKAGIKPAWEDPGNVGGQAWTLNPDSFTQKEWQDVLVKIISGSFEQTLGDHAPPLCGFTAQRKQNGKLVTELWFGPGVCEQLTVQKAIGITGKNPNIKQHPRIAQ